MVAAEVLRVEGLTKRYRGRIALEEVTLGVRPGEVYGLLGPNGAGKTTLLRIALGLIRPTSGRVLLFGNERRGAALAAHGRLGALVEIPRFLPYLSGRENLRALGVLSGADDPEGLRRALETVRLTEAADQPVRGWSQGMRQRLGIAQALLGEPELVLLDEPTNGLDPHGVREILAVIQTLSRDRGLAVLVSSHQLAEVERIANRVAILAKGRLLAEGDLDRLLRREVTRHRLVVDDAAAATRVIGEEGPPRADGALGVRATPDEVPDLVRRLVEAGVAIREVAPVRPTLEYVFLELTNASGAGHGR